MAALPTAPQVRVTVIGFGPWKPYWGGGEVCTALTPSCAREGRTRPSTRLCWEPGAEAGLETAVTAPGDTRALPAGCWAPPVQPLASCRHSGLNKAFSGFLHSHLMAGAAV